LKKQCYDPFFYTNGCNLSQKIANFSAQIFTKMITLAPGPAATFPEHAPRDEAAKLEEARGEIQFHVVSNSLTEKVPKQVRQFCDQLLCRLFST
jgi:hypothetical protein